MSVIISHIERIKKVNTKKKKKRKNENDWYTFCCAPQRKRAKINCSSESIDYNYKTRRSRKDLKLLHLINSSGWSVSSRKRNVVNSVRVNFMCYSFCVHFREQFCWCCYCCRVFAYRMNDEHTPVLTAIITYLFHLVYYNFVKKKKSFCFGLPLLLIILVDGGGGGVAAAAAKIISTIFFPIRRYRCKFCIWMTELPNYKQ